MKTLNSYYAEAEKIGGQSYLEGCLACATAYIIFLCMETRYEKVRSLCTQNITFWVEILYNYNFFVTCHVLFQFAAFYRG